MLGNHTESTMGTSRSIKPIHTRMPNTTTLLLRETTQNDMHMTECGTPLMEPPTDQTAQILKAHVTEREERIRNTIAMYIKKERTTDSETNMLLTVLIDLLKTREGGRSIE
uniref:Uncharacterized protein n=1 Tax=Cacopsylla melanoneura TaxID=428564 RepID=A0A8D8VAP9_9HEMI